VGAGGDWIERDLCLVAVGVILDSDLALIYGVSTGRLNEAVKRNIGAGTISLCNIRTPQM
jgi:ORF6N domain